MISYGPTFGLVLHRCPATGAALAHWLPEGDEARCVPPSGEACGAPIMPDQEPRAGHAWILCQACGRSVGLCGGQALDELAAEVASILRV